MTKLGPEKKSEYSKFGYNEGWTVTPFNNFFFFNEKLLNSSVMMNNVNKVIQYTY